MKIPAIICLLVIPLITAAQTTHQAQQVRQQAVKVSFAEQLKRNAEAIKFSSLLADLDSLAETKPLDKTTVDSLKNTGRFNFLSAETKADATVIVLDVQSYLAEAYKEAESSGAIDQLKNLRSLGLLKITSRIIANDIELPKKTNAAQSYNDFYLQVIREFMNTHRDLVMQDNMSFAVYQAWEAEKQLKTEEEVRGYREQFIKFLYQYYHLN